MFKVMLIEDDLNLGTTLRGALEERGYTVKYLSGAATVIADFNDFKPDIVLLDVNLNEELDGFAISRKIREISDVPLLFTTSRDENADFEQAFSIPDTDYVRKPYRLAEVLKRIEKLIANDKPHEKYEIGRFVFYPVENKIMEGSEEHFLSNFTSMVLLTLCKNKGSFVTRRNLIQMVWKISDTRLKEGSLNNALTTLRKQLESDPTVSIESKMKLGIRLRFDE